jgi:MFS family permease
MGALRAAQYLPILLFGLFAGVWVDRLPRRNLLVGADLGRALVLAAIPIAASAGVLRIEHLYVIAFAAGTLTILFDVAQQSTLPALLPRDALIGANSRLEMSLSTSLVAGPGLGGALIQLFGAPIAIAADALSFALSAVFLSRLPPLERLVSQRPQDRAVLREMKDGLGHVLGHPLLTPLAASICTLSTFYSLAMAIYVLYATTELHLESTTLGLTFGAAGIGGFVGAAAAGRIARRIGLGRTFLSGGLLYTVGLLCLPLAPGTRLPAGAVLATGMSLVGFGGLIFRVNQDSLRQAIVPDELQGRVSATMRFLTWGALPLGAVAGGALGEAIGMRAALGIAGLGCLTGCLWIVLSPLRTLHFQSTIEPGAN